MRKFWFIGCVAVLIGFTACGDKKKDNAYQVETSADREKHFVNTSGAKTIIEVEEEAVTERLSKIEDKAREENAKCPKEVEVGIFMTSVEVDGDEYITTYVVDEDDVDFSRFCKDIKIIREQAVYGMKVSAKHPVNQLFKQYNTTITSVYVSKQTGKKIQFSIKPSEW